VSPEGCSVAVLKQDTPAIDELASQIRLLIANNKALLLPVLDDHAIDIALTFTFLASRSEFHSLIAEYAAELSKNIQFAFNTNGAYPTSSKSYWELVEHPRRDDPRYREEATSGSVLIPLLAYWLAKTGQTGDLSRLANFAQENLDHCNHQFWFPDEQSEDELFTGTASTGNMLTDIPIAADPDVILGFVQRYVSEDAGYSNLSCVRFGHWILVLIACRYNRLPVPPQVWENLVMRQIRFPNEE